jgi:hypothetical protein
LSELFADFRKRTGVERFSLSGLDHFGVVAFMEQAAGHDLDHEGLALARAIYEETEGNPFFVGEVLRDLAETGAIYDRDGRWRTGLPWRRFGSPRGSRTSSGAGSPGSRTPRIGFPRGAGGNRPGDRGTSEFGSGEALLAA